MTSYEPQQTAPSSSDKPAINLLRGWPHPSLLPSTLIRSAASQALSDPSISTPGLLYGPDPGYQPLRASIAKWLTSFYHPDAADDDRNKNKTEDEDEYVVTPERICITGGASQNLGCILNVYTDPSYTRCVWVVAPAYFLAFRIFEDAGLAMRAVPEDAEGVDISYLRREIDEVERKAREEGREEPKFKSTKRSWAKLYKHIIYCVPTFANPSSRTMTLPRRKELVALAREADALVVCDDVYDFLQWPTSPSNSQLEARKSAHLPRLVDIDRTLPHPNTSQDQTFGNVCSNGSFSKIAGPGIRVGWCEGSPTFAYGVSQAGTTKSGGAPSQLTSTYVNVLLERGDLQQHIRTVLLPAYGRRWRKLMGAIETFLVPMGFRLPEHNAAMEEVAGGYFTWLTLPSALSSASMGKTTSAAETLAQRCLAEENVTLAPGKIFEVPHDHGNVRVSFGDCVRLCWSWEDEGNLEEGVGRIARVAGRMLDEVSMEKRKEDAEVEEAEGAGLRKGYVLVKK